MRKTEEVKRFGLLLSPLFALSGSELPEANKTRFVGIQLQAELGKSLSELGIEPSSIRLILKTHDDVVSVAHDDHIAMSVSTPPLLGPQIEDVVEVHIRQQGRDRRPLRTPCALHSLDPVHDDPRAEPFLDQPNDTGVRYPVLDKSQHPSVINGIEKSTDVHVEHPVHMFP